MAIWHQVTRCVILMHASALVLESHVVLNATANSSAGGLSVCVQNELRQSADRILDSVQRFEHTPAVQRAVGVVGALVILSSQLDWLRCAEDTIAIEARVANAATGRRAFADVLRCTSGLWRAKLRYFQTVYGVCSDNKIVLFGWSNGRLALVLPIG